jgi:hypothetical protein
MSASGARCGRRTGRGAETRLISCSRRSAIVLLPKGFFGLSCGRPLRSSLVAATVPKTANETQKHSRRTMVDGGALGLLRRSLAARQVLERLARSDLLATLRYDRHLRSALAAGVVPSSRSFRFLEGNELPQLVNGRDRHRRRMLLRAVHKWQLAIYFACYAGVSPTELHRAIGIATNSKSEMLARIKWTFHPGASIGLCRS